MILLNYRLRILYEEWEVDRDVMPLGSLAFVS